MADKSRLATAYVQIVPSADGIKGKLTEALGGEASSAGDAAGASFGSGLIGVAGKAIAAAGLGQMLAKSISAGGALEQSIGGIETEMERLLKDAQEVSGVQYDINNLNDVYEAIHVIQGELGFVIIGGLCTSTVLALFLMPPFYLLFDGPKKPKKQRRKGRRARGAKEEPARQ